MPKKPGKKIYLKTYRLDHICNYSRELSRDRLCEILGRNVDHSEAVTGHFMLLWHEPAYAIKHAKKVAKYLID